MRSTDFRTGVTGTRWEDDENKLEHIVANLLIYRQIGEEQLPEDSDRNDHRTLNKWT